jgi:3-dehydroquinate synthase
MLVAAQLARSRGLFSADGFDALASLIASMGPLPPIADLSATEALDAMKRDKKVLDGRLHYVLPVRLGETVVVPDVSEQELRAALEQVGLRE